MVARDSVGNDTKPLVVHLSWINQQPVFRPSVYAIDIPEKCGWVSIKNHSFDIAANEALHVACFVLRIITYL